MCIVFCKKTVLLFAIEKRPSHSIGPRTRSCKYNDRTYHIFVLFQSPGSRPKIGTDRVSLLA